ncbi:MAG: glycerol-3-phosphate 1-O-acyltransferase PlsB [Steroidobacteraceae bacterium]
MARLLGRILMLWVRHALGPEDAAARLARNPRPVCYVLEQHHASDFAVLQRACARARLPRPSRQVDLGDSGRQRACFALTRSVGVWRSRLDRRAPPALLTLLRALADQPELDIALVPAAVYWGRAPQKERSWLRLIFSEDWALVGSLQRFFTVLINGRNTLVQIGEPISLRALVASNAGKPALAARRIARGLRLELAKQRSAHLGPDLSHRRVIVQEVLNTHRVRAAVASERRERGISRRAALHIARQHADEIAANYSHAFVNVMARLFTRLWNRLYDGVEFGHAATLREVAPGNEIVFVPCHRSHMDYMLLSYAIYMQGFAVPHIAAGINLNLPIIGRFLRKGGAFFIRRSFRGSSMYTVVFMQYLAAIMARGHSIEYFIEGGRSRTGRLLQPRTGMVSMTIRSFLREPTRPIVFVPVYFGYERVMEAASYVGELSGQPKKKESTLGVLRSLRLLREKFGRVHVNLGEPVHLTALLDRQEPEWRHLVAEEQVRASWLNRSVDEAALAIMRNINAAAAVTPINLLALVLLATPRHVMLEADLRQQLELYLQLLRSVPYGPRVTVTSLSATQIIAYGESMQVLVRGDNLLRLEATRAPFMAYYRNNVLHLLALPSLLACCFFSNTTLRTEDIQRLAWRIYPYISAELFLCWEENEVPGLVLDMLRALAQCGLLEASADGATWRRPAPASAQAMQLSLLAQPMIQTIERYYLAIALLIRAGSGTITQSHLEERCKTMAQRMVTLYGFYSPEFFDRTLFEGFIDLLRARGVLRLDGEGKLAFDDVLMRIASDAQLVLSEALRHSILQITHG